MSMSRDEMRVACTRPEGYRQNNEPRKVILEDRFGKHYDGPVDNALRGITEYNWDVAMKKNDEYAIAYFRHEYSLHTTTRFTPPHNLDMAYGALQHHENNLFRAAMKAGLIPEQEIPK